MLYLLIYPLLVCLPTGESSEEVSEYEHHGAQDCLGVAIDVCAELVEVSFFQQSVKGEAGILCKIEVRHASCKVEGRPSRIQKVLSPEVFD